MLDKIIRIENTIKLMIENVENNTKSTEGELEEYDSMKLSVMEDLNLVKCNLYFRFTRCHKFYSGL